MPKQLGSMYKKNRKVDGKVVKSRKWYGTYYCSLKGARVTRSLYTDKAASRKKLDDLVRESEQKAEGIIDRHQAQRNIALSIHINDYLAQCEHESQATKHINVKRADLKRLSQKTNANRLSDLDPITVQKHLQWLKKSEGLSARKINAVRAHANAFMNWCVKTFRSSDNPLKGLPILNEKLDKRHERRAYTDAELVLLLDAAEKRTHEDILRCNRGKNKGKLTNRVTDEAVAAAKATGRYKRQIYSFAVQTGLRRNEIKNITWSDIDLVAKSIRVRIEVGKAKREDFIPIVSSLMPELINFKPKGTQPNDLVFIDGLPDSKAFNFDLERAGIEKLNSENQVVDFHALRHTTATNLVRAGIQPMQLQEFMRHSDLKTTMTFYVHTKMEDMHAAIDKLPALNLKLKLAGDDGTG